MPFPRNWSEELVSEYLELEGYFVRTGHPVPIGKRGGRREIDGLGIKVVKDELEILHVEIGIPSLSIKDLKKALEEKFGSLVKREIDRIASDFGFQNYVWKRWFIDVWRGTRRASEKWKKIKQELKDERIEILTFNDFWKKITEAIGKWQEKHKTEKGTLPALPQNLWLLKMVERVVNLDKFLNVRNVEKL